MLLPGKWKEDAIPLFGESSLYLIDWGNVYVDLSKPRDCLYIIPIIYGFKILKLG